MVRYTVGTEPCYTTLSPNKPFNIGCSLFYNKQVNDIFKIVTAAVQTSKVSVFAPNYGSSPYEIDSKQPLPANEAMRNVGQEFFNPKKSDSTEKQYDISELKGLLFLEEWVLNKAPFEFTKKVVAYSPIRKFLKVEMINANDYCHSLPFMVVDSLQNDVAIEKSNKRMLLTNKVKYEYLFNTSNSFWNREEEFEHYSNMTDGELRFSVASNSSPLLNKNGERNLINLLLDKAVKESYPVYDFETQQRLSVENIKKNIGISIDSVRTTTLEGRDTVVVMPHTLEIDEFKSVIFHEEWYIDPETLRMQKKVVGLTPVRYYLDAENSDKSPLKRKAVFTIYFDQNKKF
jgi:hypothetical protein